MKRINKEESPREFEQWKGTKARVWKDLLQKENHPIKKILKRSLLSDQGYICCYCQKRVEDDKYSEIEHLKCKEFNPNIELDYKNMLISCKGGQKERFEEKDLEKKREIPIYCGGKKDNDDIFITPLDHNCEEMFRYGSEGEIYSTDIKTEKTIEILGLRNTVLKNLRRAAIDGFLDNGELPPFEEIQEIIKILSSKKDGKYYEFCNVVVNFFSSLS